MRKVNNYEIISLLMFINITMYLGININIIKTTTGVNAWLTVLISNIIGFIPLILFLYIANYKPELKLNEFYRLEDEIYPSIYTISYPIKKRDLLLIFL